MNALHFILSMLLTLTFAGLNTGQETCKGNQTSYMRLAYRKANVTLTKMVKTDITIAAEDCNFFQRLKSWLRTDRCDTRISDSYREKTYNKVIDESYPVIECCMGYIMAEDNDTCIEGCPQGKFGDNCAQNCSCANQNLFCDDTGDCLCPQGYTGVNCTDECEDGFFGHNCTYECMCQNNSTCNRATGACNCTLPGWEGDMCSTECTNGTYGLLCNESCSCNENETCHHVTGNCTCKPGWGGDSCSHECEQFTFGIGCMESCTCNKTLTEYCDRESGLCYCKPGYVGNNCSHECPYGFYGQGCHESCADRCSGNIYCDHVNGTCMCYNKKGINCSEDCENGTYGHNCEMNCTCNTYDSSGSCINYDTCICLPGWTGPNCTQECRPGFYGQDCNYNCTGKCKDTAHCDRFNGICSEENKETASIKQKGDQESFIEENLLYIVIPVASVLLVVALGTVFYRCRITAQKRDKNKKDCLDINAQENPGYSPCNKETIPLENSEKTIPMYEDAVLEKETSGETSNNVLQFNKAPGNIDSDHVIENGVHACAETNVKPDTIDDEYSVPDKDTDKKNDINDGEHSKERGKPHQEEELYDTTQDSAQEKAQSEYNTFQDVIKIQQEASRKKSDSEDDYDVITRTDSHKAKLEDIEHYSSFEQVRKLSLKNSLDEEDTYNALNEHLSGHKSALVNDTRYHHISLKDKTVDGKTFTTDAPPARFSTQRQISSGKRSFQDSIREEHEDEEGMILNEDKTKPQSDEMLEEDMTEAIYDECDLDDLVEEHNSEKSKLIPDDVVESKINTADITEIVYEECDEPGDEQSRPPSAVVYEDVDEDHSEHDSEDEETEEGEEDVQSKPTQHIKRAVDRRREDYEDFAL